MKAVSRNTIGREELVKVAIENNFNANAAIDFIYSRRNLSSDASSRSTSKKPGEFY